jgi:hypothetical protein
VTIAGNIEFDIAISLNIFFDPQMFCENSDISWQFEEK